MWLQTLKPSAQAGSSLADFFTLRMETIRSCETSVHTRSTFWFFKDLDLLYDTHPFFSAIYLRLFIFRLRKTFFASYTISIWTISLFFYLQAYVQKLS
jgi:hypothetical protein